jgi:hypothetical protein
LLFILAAFWGIVPDMCTTLAWNTRNRKKFGMYPVLQLHRLHRKIHWFENDNPDGSVTFRFSNAPLLAVEFCCAVVILVVLFLPVVRA